MTRDVIRCRFWGGQTLISFFHYKINPLRCEAILTRLSSVILSPILIQIDKHEHNKSRMLCDKCQALFQGDLPEVDKLGEIHISNQDRCNYGRLNEGCFLCYGLWQQIRQLSPNTTLDSSLPLIITRTLIILATTVWKTLGYFIFDAQAEQQTSEINGVRDLHYVIISGKEYLRWSRPACECNNSCFHCTILVSRTG